MRPYKISDTILKNIQKEFKKALEQYKHADTAFSFKYTPAKSANTKKVKVYCLPTAWCKITTLVQKTDSEIAWHMLINKVSKTQYIITDVLVYPQTATGSTVNTDDTKYALWVNNIPDKEFEMLRGQGHSHVNMGVTPSSVDAKYYSDLLQTVSKGFYIFMIINKKGDIHLQLIDIDANIVYETADIAFEIATKDWYQNKWYTEVMKNISQITNTHHRNFDRAYNGYGITNTRSTIDKNESKFSECIGDDWYDRFM